MSQVHEAPAMHRSARISMRVDPEMDGFLRCAADIEHKSLTAFMLDAACTRAKQVVQEHQRIALSSRELARVLDELDRPAEVVLPLQSLAEKIAKEDNA